MQAPCPLCRDDQGRTALHLVAEFGLAEAAQLLLVSAEEMQALQQQAASAGTEAQLPKLELLQVQQSLLEERIVYISCFVLSTMHLRSEHSILTAVVPLRKDTSTMRKLVASKETCCE